MPPNSDFIDGAVRAFSPRPRASFGTRTPAPFGGAPGRRRAVDPAAMWVRITLATVVAALLFYVLSAPKPQPAAKVAPLHAPARPAPASP